MIQEVGDHLVEFHIRKARVVISDRSGGVSKDNYESLNLADHVGDDAEAVQTNRKRFAEVLGTDVSEICWMEQKHGARVSGASPEESPKADGLVTSVPGRPLTILTADCAPVVLIGQHTVGVAHAGWKGLRAGIIGEVIQRMRDYGEENLVAFLGPTIRPLHYEFGAEELKRLARQFGPKVYGQTKEGNPALDLPATVREALYKSGVETLEDSGLDTFSDANFYSYRRDGTTGRMATTVILND